MHGIRFGYTAMTWGNEERQAIDDIAAVGFPGIQFRANAVTEFKPAELKDLSGQHKLTLRRFRAAMSPLMSRRQTRSQNTWRMHSSSRFRRSLSSGSGSAEGICAVGHAG
jgi:hypothetical protein